MINRKHYCIKCDGKLTVDEFHASADKVEYQVTPCACVTNAIIEKLLEKREAMYRKSARLRDDNETQLSMVFAIQGYALDCVIYFIQGDESKLNNL